MHAVLQELSMLQIGPENEICFACVSFAPHAMLSQLYYSTFKLRHADKESCSIDGSRASHIHKKFLVPVFLSGAKFGSSW